MKLATFNATMLKDVAGVFGTQQPIVRGCNLEVRQGRLSSELIQGEGQNRRVIASGNKDNLLTWAAKNDLRVTNYTAAAQMPMKVQMRLPKPPMTFVLD
jgi:hypothetical protein